MSADILPFDRLMQALPDDEEELKAIKAELQAKIQELEAPMLKRRRITNHKADIIALRRCVRELEMGLGVMSVEHEAVMTIGGTRK